MNESGETVYFALSQEDMLRNRARLLEEASHGIYVLMDDQGVSRSDLARRLGRSRSFVTKILDGSHNFTLEKIADVYLVLGRTIHLLLSEPDDQMRLPVDEVRKSSTMRATWSTEFEMDDLRSDSAFVVSSASATHDRIVGTGGW